VGVGRELEGEEEQGAVWQIPRTLHQQPPAPLPPPQCPVFPRPISPSPAAYDTDVAKKLFEVSQELVGAKVAV
jgi:hypothetical protein